MKKAISLMLAVVMSLSIFISTSSTVFARSYITNSSNSNGSNYTSSSALADQLNKIFKGDIDLYANSSCSTEISLPLGYSMNTGSTYHVKSKTTGNLCSGKQCYICKCSI